MSFPLAFFRSDFCSSLELFVFASYGKSIISQIAQCKIFLLSMPGHLFVMFWQKGGK